MKLSIHQSIEGQIDELIPGELVFPTDFRGKGSEAAIKMSLSRLVKEKKLERVAHGIYYRPKIHPIIGKLLPSPEEVAKGIAKKERVRIRPTGAYALNQLGLSEQVPTKLSYITDGQARAIKVGKAEITFKHTTPKKFSMKGQISSLLIQGLEELGIKNMELATDNFKEKIKLLIEKENPADLKHDLQLAPGKIHDFILNIISKEND